MAAFWRCGISASEIAERFEYVREQDNEFLALFPHRYDYIYAPFPEPRCKPNWHTESRHPLSDRIIQQGGYLYGVRFGSTTTYALLDIDATSSYHPRRDSFAVSRLMAALEPLGLVRSVICTSSDSGGLHLYFPFTQALPSWKIARVMAYALQQAGFKLYPGQLELFPNPKSYNRAGKPTLYHAHRLPLQIGSYLLNADFQPIWSSSDTFVKYWHSAKQANTLETKTLARYLKQTWQGFQPISGGAKKFIQDLNAEIEAGWSSYGQTNRLLGRIAMRTYIFHHILHGGEPLTGQALVNRIVAVAQSLPGYKDWCQHQHEIVQRAADWARSVEKSHYFHYGLHYELHYKGTGVKLGLENAPKSRSNWNQQQFNQTRVKIQNAVSKMQKLNELPERTTERFNKLTKIYGISGSSLYRHQDLWHPKEFKVQDTAQDLDQDLEECLEQSLVIERLKNLDRVKTIRLQNLNGDFNSLNGDFSSLNGDFNSRNWSLDYLGLDLEDLRLRNLSRVKTLKNLDKIKDLDFGQSVYINTDLNTAHINQLDPRHRICTSLLQVLGCNPSQSKALASVTSLQFSQFQGCNFDQDLYQDFGQAWGQVAALESTESSKLPVELSILRQYQQPNSVYPSQFSPHFPLSSAEARHLLVLQPEDQNALWFLLPSILRLSGVLRSHFKNSLSKLTDLPMYTLIKLQRFLQLNSFAPTTDKALPEKLDQHIRQIIDLICQLPNQPWGNVSPKFALETQTLAPQ